MEAPKITVELGRVRKMMKPFKAFDDDYEISFEYVMGSCFPNVYQNVMDSLKDSYTQGYLQGLKEAKENEN